MRVDDDEQDGDSGSDKGSEEGGREGQMIWVSPVKQCD